MNNKWLLILPLILFTFLCACGGKKNKSTAGDDNPIFKTKELAGITDKIKDDPTNAKLYYNRGLLLHKMQADTLALNDFKKAAKLDTTKAEYFSAVGDLMFDHKDIDGSVQWLQKAIKLSPTDPKAHLKIAKMFLYLRDYPKAFNEINTVLRQDVYNPEAYFLKGMVYRDLKDTARAISSLQTAVQVAPDYRDAVLELGQMYSTKKDPIALKYYDNAFKLDTTDVFPLFARGVYYQMQNNVAQAKMEYHNCISHDPQYANAFFNMGYILLQQDSVEKAYRQYDIVTKIEPNNAAAYYNRGLCSEILNKKDDAIQDYRQAIVFDSAYQEPRAALKRLGAKTKE